MEMPTNGMIVQVTIAMKEISSNGRGIGYNHRLTNNSTEIIIKHSNTLRLKLQLKLQLRLQLRFQLRLQLKLRLKLQMKLQLKLQLKFQLKR